jgi:CheY-like chemotaxis protein
MSTEIQGLDRPLKILVVDDDVASRMVLSVSLKKNGNTVILANSGIEAIKICQNQADIDLVLMDIRMPDMDGYEASQEIRKFNKDIVIITQTSNEYTGGKLKAIEAGGNDYISKPINFQELNAIIERHFNK